jgi:hypothetical protein
MSNFNSKPARPIKVSAGGGGDGSGTDTDTESQRVTLPTVDLTTARSMRFASATSSQAGSRKNLGRIGSTSSNLKRLTSQLSNRSRLSTRSRRSDSHGRSEEACLPTNIPGLDAEETIADPKQNRYVLSCK